MQGRQCIAREALVFSSGVKRPLFVPFIAGHGPKRARTRPAGLLDGILGTFKSEKTHAPGTVFSIPSIKMVILKSPGEIGWQDQSINANEEM